MKVYKDKFKVKIDNQEVELAVIKPNQKQLDEAQKIYNKKYCDLVKNGAFIRPQMEAIIKDRGVWDESKDKEMESLRKKLLDGERQLAKGGITKSAGREVAMQMIKDRNKLIELSLLRSSLDGQTSEAQAENHRFSFLISVCTVYNDNGQTLFANFEDYLDKADNEYATTCGIKLAGILNDISDLRAKLPENKFLIKYKFMNEKFILLDKLGRLVNTDGKHIDDDGRFISWHKDLTSFDYVDLDGNLVNKEGDYIDNIQPFWDDEEKLV